MPARSLKVIVCNDIAGTLEQNAHGAISFSYDEGYSGIPLSSSMPISNRSYDQKPFSLTCSGSFLTASSSAAPLQPNTK